MTQCRHFTTCSLFCYSTESGLARWARWTLTGPQKRLPAAKVAKAKPRSSSDKPITHHAAPLACQSEVASWGRRQEVAVTQLVTKEEDQEQGIRGWRWDWPQFDTWWYRVRGWAEGRGEEVEVRGGRERETAICIQSSKTCHFPNRALPFYACSRDFLERKSSGWEWRWVIDHSPTFLSHLQL